MNKSGKYITLIIGLGIAGFLLWYFSAIVIYILVAAVISLIGQPVVRFLNKIKIWKFKIPQGLCSLITLLLILTFFFTFFRIFIPIVAEQAQQISQIDPKIVKQNLEGPLQNVQVLAEKFKILSSSDQTVQEYLTQKAVNILSISNVSNVFNSITGMLGNLFVAIFSISFISFFFLKDENMFYNMVFAITPTRFEDEIKNALNSIKKLLMRYFIGITLDILCVIILITLGLSIVGLDIEHALLIALFVGIVNVIPYIGFTIGVLFGLLMGILTNVHLDFYTEIFPLLGLMLLVFGIVQALDAILIQPIIYSSSVKAHPLEIFLLIMIAGSVAGILGMLVAIPVYTVLRVIAKEFFNQVKVVKKLTKNI